VKKSLLLSYDRVYLLQTSTEKFSTERERDLTNQPGQIVRVGLTADRTAKTGDI